MRYIEIKVQRSFWILFGGFMSVAMVVVTLVVLGAAVAAISGATAERLKPIPVKNKKRG